jgi:hypothetical protein
MIRHQSKRNRRDMSILISFYVLALNMLSNYLPMFNRSNSYNGSLGKVKLIRHHSMIHHRDMLTLFSFYELWLSMLSN